MTSQAAVAAALFDMDGVLIQSREAIEHGWRSVALDYGITVSDADAHEHIHGRPGSHTLATVFGALSDEQRRAVKQRVDAREEVADCALTEGVAAFLRELADAGVPAALVTSSWQARIDHVLRQHGLTGYFRATVHRDDVARGKPDPEGYLLAARRLGVAPDACVVFEDAQSGVTAAVRSGAACIGIGDDPGLLACGARVVVPSFVGLRLADLAGYLRA